MRVTPVLERPYADSAQPFSLYVPVFAALKRAYNKKTEFKLSSNNYFKSPLQVSLREPMQQGSRMRETGIDIGNGTQKVTFRNTPVP